MGIKKFSDYYFDPAKVIIGQHFHKEEDEMFIEHLDLWFENFPIKVMIEDKESIRKILSYLEIKQFYDDIEGG